MRKITIEIPYKIPRILTPNRSRKVHWGTIAKAKTEAQRAAFYAMVSARNNYQIAHREMWMPLGRATCEYFIYIKDRRSIYDDDNIIAGLKHIRDALQMPVWGQGQQWRAGIIKDDSQLVTKRINWIIGKEKAPLIRMEVTEW